MNKIEKAKLFAKNKHRGQLDDNGESYYHSHCVQTYEILKCITDNEDILCAGLLHDTLEDTNTLYEELERRFGKKVADLVYQVTKEKDDGRGYFPRLKDEHAILIKFADRLSNLSRMNCWDDKKKRWYLKKSKFWSEE